MANEFGSQGKTVMEQLGSLVYFSGLTSRELEGAARVLSPVEVKAGETVFCQGEEGAWVYLLAQGAVDVWIEIPSGRASSPSTSGASSASGASSSGGVRRVLASLHPPALLGEISVLLDEPRSASATATEDCVLWQVSREDVRLAVEANHKWAQRLLLAMSKILAARLAETNRQVAQLAMERERPLSHRELETLQQSLLANEQGAV